MEMGSPGTMQVKVFISMRAASPELSREGSCACRSRACFPWRSQALSEEKSTLQMVQEGWGLMAAAAHRGTSGPMGAKRVLEEGARRGGEPPHPPGGSSVLILLIIQLLDAERKRQEGCSLAPFFQPSPSLWGLRLTCPWRGEWGPYCRGSVIIRKAFLHFHSFCTLS